MTHTAANYGSAGTAIILAVFAAIFLWKGILPRVTAWLCMAIGLLGASLVAQWIGLISWTVHGVPVSGLISVGLLVTFFIEVIRGIGHHHIRSPLVALGAGLCLALLPGSVSQIAHDVTHNVPSVTTQDVSRVTGQG